MTNRLMELYEESYRLREDAMLRNDWEAYHERKPAIDAECKAIEASLFNDEIVTWNERLAKYSDY